MDIVVSTKASKTAVKQISEDVLVIGDRGDYEGNDFEMLSMPYSLSVDGVSRPIALTIQTFVGKVLSLLLNMLSRFVIAFLARSKHLIISWLQSPSSVILEPKKVKSYTVSTISPSICHEVMGPDAMIFIF